jgi:hypothetical protein
MANCKENQEILLLVIEKVQIVVEKVRRLYLLFSNIKDCTNNRTLFVLKLISTGNNHAKLGTSLQQQNRGCLSRAALDAESLPFKAIIPLMSAASMSRGFRKVCPPKQSGKCYRISHAAAFVSMKKTDLTDDRATTSVPSIIFRCDVLAQEIQRMGGPGLVLDLTQWENRGGTFITPAVLSLLHLRGQYRGSRPEGATRTRRRRSPIRSWASPGCGRGSTGENRCRNLSRRTS